MDSEWVIVDRHLYLTEDGSRVVEEGDSRSRWLKWAPGNRVPAAEYRHLTRELGRPTETVQLPAPKKRAPAANKRRGPAHNK